MASRLLGQSLSDLFVPFIASKIAGCLSRPDLSLLSRFDVQMRCDTGMGNEIEVLLNHVFAHLQVRRSHARRCLDRSCSIP